MFNQSQHKSYPFIALCLIVFCFTTYHVISWIVPHPSPWKIQPLIFLIPAILAIYFFLPDKRKNFLFLMPSLNQIILLICLTIFVSLFTHGLSFYWEQMFPLPPIYKKLLSQNLPQIPHAWMKPKIFFTLCLIPAICEEYLFRGFLQNTLKQSWGSNLAIIVSALFFTLAHLNPWQAPFFFILGLYLGWCQNWRNNIFLPILAHGLNNFVALILLDMVSMTS